MRSLHERKIKGGAAPHLQPGEEVLAAFVARPRGWTQQHAGLYMAGTANTHRNVAAAERARLPIGSPMALAITGRRLISFRIGSPIGLGIGGAVKEMLGSLPLAEVDAIHVQPLALGFVVTVATGGQEIALEANAAANVSGLVSEFQRARPLVAHAA